MTGAEAPVAGVVVMAYGTPASGADVEPYYTHIRRGRPPERQQLADLQRRYDAIGGVSPLAERTEAQRAAIARSLEALVPGGFSVVLGHKHAAPFVEDAVAALADEGIDRVVGLVLAPHHSAASVGQYHDRARAAADERELAYAAIDSWHTEPAWLDFQAAAVTEALGALPMRTEVRFTAHSLPERSLVDDPYPGQLAESAGLVAERAGLGTSAWSLAWQSAGRTPEPWQGPDVLEVIRSAATAGDLAGVLVCPQGFTSDHLEVCFDLDIEARGVAEEVGLAFARTRSVNDDPAVMAALADRVVAASRG